MERRVHPRVTLPMRVHVWTPKGEFEAESVDLSLGGMLLAHSPELVEVGTSVELEVAPPGATATLRFEGEITRIADPGGIERPSLVGLRFTEANRDGIVTLAETVERYVPWLPSMYDAEDEWQEVAGGDSDPTVGGRLKVKLGTGREVPHRYATALSPTALFMRTDEQIEDGTRLTLQISPASNGVREFVGRVATTVPEDSEDRLLPGIGIDLGPRAWIVGQRPVFTCDHL